MQCNLRAAAVRRDFEHGYDDELADAVTNYWSAAGFLYKYTESKEHPA
jgi:hypothetical protein